MNSCTIPLHDLEGRWYIVLSNFPMWLKGDKTVPSLNYAVEIKGTVTGLRDEVISQKRGKPQSIVGFDTPLDSANTRFLWRGKGLLSLLTSRWEIVHLEAHLQWAIIHFEKTLFTPEGYDVIARRKQLSPEMLVDIQSALRECGITAELQPIVQEINTH
jgi:hypothetical protein